VSDVFAFEVWVASVPEFRDTINARSASKAKYQYLIRLQDCWPDYQYTDLRVRKVGPPVTPEAFQRNAKYRGIETAYCGQRVTVGNSRGVIVGHNSSANLDILFDDDAPKYAGETLNVHPSSVQFEESANA